MDWKKDLRDTFPEIYQRIHAPILLALEAFIEKVELKERVRAFEEGYKYALEYVDCEHCRDALKEDAAPTNISNRE